MHDLRCLKPFCTIDEAAAIEAVLEDAGVRCEISEEAGGVWGAQVGSLGSARVLVAEEDVEKARQILASREVAEVSEDSPSSEQEEDDYWNAPEAFAPFAKAADESARDSQSWEYLVFGPFWVIYFAILLVLFGIGAYYLISILATI